jgi:hypothetical protein
VASRTSEPGRDRGSKKNSAARTSAQARIAAQRAVQQKNERRRNLIVTGGTLVGVIVIVAVIVAIGIHSKSKSSSGSGNAVVAAPASVTSAITAAAGVLTGTPDFSTVAGAPTSISSTAISSGGKPQVLYVGAEYCPYCAATRWPLAVALSRFGSFSNLKTTYSSDSDTAGPHTPTLSFIDATYTSSYISFDGKEQEDGLGKPLETLTSQENSLFTSLGGGSYPFIDFGGKWLQHGTIFDPTVLKGLTPEQVAASLTETTGTVGPSISASADLFTAAICNIDGNKPANVCNAKGVSAASVALVASTAK